MAKIFGFSIKGLKVVEGIYSASLYFEDMRLGKIENNEGVYSLNWVKKITNKEKETIYTQTASYFEKYPKLIQEQYSSKELLVLELIDDLVLLEKIEQVFSLKKHRKENKTIIRLTFHNRETDKYRPEKIISCKNWEKAYKEKIIKIYSPKHFTIFENFSDFNII